MLAKRNFIIIIIIIKTKTFKLYAGKDITKSVKNKNLIGFFVPTLD